MNHFFEIWSVIVSILKMIRIEFTFRQIVAHVTIFKCQKQQCHVDSFELFKTYSNHAKRCSYFLFWRLLCNFSSKAKLFHSFDLLISRSRVFEFEIQLIQFDRKKILKWKNAKLILWCSVFCVKYSLLSYVFFNVLRFFNMLFFSIAFWHLSISHVFFANWSRENLIVFIAQM